MPPLFFESTEFRWFPNVWSNNELITWIDLLMFEQYLMNIIWVRVLPGEYRAQDLKDMRDALCVVDIRIADELKRVRVAEERKL